METMKTQIKIIRNWYNYLITTVMKILQLLIIGIKYTLEIFTNFISDLAQTTYDYHLKFTKYKLYRIGIDSIPNHWEKDRNELRYIIVKERFYMISYYGLFVIFLVLLLILWFLKYLFTLYTLYKYHIIPNSELMLLPLVLRTARRGLFISSIRQRFGPVSKTIANKFSVVSLISMLSFETLTSLVFLIVAYLIILIIGGIIVYCNQSDLTKLSLIFSLLPLTEFKSNMIDLQSTVVQLVIDSQTNLKTQSSTFMDNLCYLYDNYFKYYLITHTLSFLAHIFHDTKSLLISWEYIFYGETHIDSMLFFPLNYIVHYTAYFCTVIKFYWVNPFLEMLATIYHIPSRGVSPIFNTTFFSELVWLYNYIDDFISYKIFHLQDPSDGRLSRFILNKDWFKDFFVKSVKYRIIKIYYKCTGQENRLLFLQDRIDGEHVTYIHELLDLPDGDQPIELFDNTTQEAVAGENNQENNDDGDDAPAADPANINANNPVQNEPVANNHIANEPVANNPVQNQPATATEGSATSEDSADTLPFYSRYGTTLTQTSPNTWVSDITYGEISTLKYILVDSPFLRTSIAVTTALIIKYSAKVLVNSLISS